MQRHALQNLSVADYARLSGRSAASFNRDFKRLFGTSPQRWLIDQRLARAHHQMLETRSSVTEIAMNIGYDSTSHFIAQFKRRYGVTPKQLRLAELSTT